MATEQINSTAPARCMDSSAALAHQQFLNEFMGRLQPIGDLLMASFVRLIASSFFALRKMHEEKNHGA